MSSLSLNCAVSISRLCYRVVSIVSSLSLDHVNATQSCCLIESSVSCCLYLSIALSVSHHIYCVVSIWLSCCLYYSLSCCLYCCVSISLSLVCIALSVLCLIYCVVSISSFACMGWTLSFYCVIRKASCGEQGKTSLVAICDRLTWHYCSCLLLQYDCVARRLSS